MIRDRYLDINKLTTDKRVLKIFKIFAKNGGTVRFVGGAVRDALQGRKIYDLDLSTDLSPDEMVEACEDAGIRTFPLGLRFGTLGIMINDTRLEITSLRKKIKDSSEFEFTDNWEEDASARDLTINAVYADEEGNVFDYYNGIEDLEKGVVRFIGSADNRIKEDYLRILRFFRFYSLFGKGEPDKKSLSACWKNRSGLKTVAIERIRDELAKIMLSENAPLAFKLMFENDILSNWLGDSDNLDKLQNLISIEEKVNSGTDALRRLFIMYLPDKALAENIAMRLRLTKKQKEMIVRLASNQDSLSDFFDEKKRLKMIYQNSKDFCETNLLIKAALENYSSTDLLDIINAIRDCVVPVLPISGRDVIRLGIEDYGKIGTIVDELEKQWLSSDFLLSRDDLLAKVGAYLPKLP